MNNSDEYTATKEFVEKAWQTMPKLYQQILGNILIAGYSEDEVADLLGQEVIRDKDGSPVAAHSISRVIQEAYRLLAQKGYGRESVHKFTGLMETYLL